MQKFIKTVVTLIMILFFCPHFGYCDIIFMRNGDKVHGKVQNAHFAVETPYSQIVVPIDFLKKIAFNDRRTNGALIQSLNNDHFRGKILLSDIQVLLDNGEQKAIQTKQVKKIRFDNGGPSRRIRTAVFTMKNGDRFSGRFNHPEVTLQTGYMKTQLKREDINRIEFDADTPTDVKVLLINGDEICGDFMLTPIEVIPDTAPRLTLNKVDVRSIQFNAHKMVLREFQELSPSAIDSDGDGISDPLDKCPDTPWGVEIDENGCSKVSQSAAVTGIRQSSTKPQEKTMDRPLDKDGDGVLDDQDRCPRTPWGAKVNTQGCWEIKDILFEFDQYELKPLHFTALKEVVTVLKQNPDLKIEIRGNTDDVGPEDYNQELSDRRAQVVKNYILENGIQAERLRAVGFGSHNSRASNKTESGRALNRRIDIVPLN